jgi:glycosyltransferase involved in cell wall biosynthesis
MVEGVRDWLAVHRPELVCVSGGNFSDGLQWMELVVAMGLPLVIVVQANAEFLWPADVVAERLRAVYAGARRVCCVSRRNLELLRDQLVLPLPNSEVVWNPFKVSFDAEPAWPGTAAGWKLACVARLEPSAKGQDLLFRVMARPEWKALPLTVSLFGDGPMRKGVERLAAQLGVVDRVVARGHVDSIEAIWREHHALVLPSRYEGLPLALVEAQLCGRPAIVTDVAGNTEMVEEGLTGFVAPAPTEEFLAAALERAWQARERWREIGIEAREQARRRVPADPCAVFAARLLALAA